MSTGRIPSTYAAARHAFREAADRHGWPRSTHPLTARGPEGEELTIDVAHSPGESPRVALVVLSGVHGVEAPIGSALQVDAIERMAGRLPDGMRVVMVHVVNPWGAAWLRRQNESNVDLNRNWVRDRAEPPANPDYALVHEQVVGAHVELGDTEGAVAAVTALAAAHGIEWVERAINSGQTSHPDGLHYAGERTEQSNRILEAVVPPLVHGVRALHVLDLHTGIGRRGTITRITDRKPGRVSWGLVDLVGAPRGDALTVEVGTVGDLRQLKALLDERWVDVQGDRSRPDHFAAVWAHRCCFTPDDEEWEQLGMHHGRVEIDEAAAAAWRDGGSWMSARMIDGGIDQVPLAAPGGGLSLCGKHAVAPDVQAAMRRSRATTVVCLVEEHEVAGHWPQYAEWLRANDGSAAVWFPIHDLHAPAVERTVPFLDGLQARLDRGEHLLVHCAAGIGRTGTIAACILVRQGLSVDDALERVRAARPGAGPEVGPQLDLVRAVAAVR